MDYSSKLYGLWRKVTSMVLLVVFGFQFTLPVYAASKILTDETIQTDFDSNPQFIRKPNKTYEYKIADYIEKPQASGFVTMESFYNDLKNEHVESLSNVKKMLPIMVGDITVVIPIYPIEQQIGDEFVQSRYIRKQIKNQLSRSLIDGANSSMNTEGKQSVVLYNNAIAYAKQSGKKFGERLTESDYPNLDIIWPEYRQVHGKRVLVPVVYLTQATIDARKVKNHEVALGNGKSTFNSVAINAGTLKTYRNTTIKVAEKFVNKSQVVSQDNLTIVAEIFENLSGQISVERSLDVVADSIKHKTVVYRFNTQHGQSSRLGKVASIEGETVRLISRGDIDIEGAKVSAERNIVFKARNNIIITSADAVDTFSGVVDGFEIQTSELQHLGSKITAGDNISLLANGTISITASELIAQEGTLNILAQQGIYISNEYDEFQSQRHGKVGSVTETENEFRSIAIRSALDAGRSVLIDSAFGDISLRATEITSKEGTNINANNGEVNLLLAKEQLRYYFNKVDEGFWRVKTVTQEDKVDTAVYNTIVGGVDINAAKGLTLEFGRAEDESIVDILKGFETSPDLAWMAEIYGDDDYNEQINVIYQELLEIHKYDKSSQLGAGAMAIIATAVAVALGPGSGAIGTGGTGAVGSAASSSWIAGYVSTAALGAAAEAAVLTMSTQVVTSLANGDNLGESLKSLTSKNNLRSLATSMLTAGVMNTDTFKEFGFFNELSITDPENLTIVDHAAMIAQQAEDVLINSTVSVGISTIVNGGDFDEFKDGLVIALKTGAVNKIGAKVANKIGSLTAEGKLDEVMRYVSHAALGCALGTATSNINDSETSNGEACTSGAIGAVVGEGTAQYSESLLSEEQKELLKVMKELGLAYDASPENMTQEQINELASIRNRLTFNPTEKDYQNIEKIRQLGVDFGKLAGATAAFAAELDVNLSALTAQNAAENNHGAALRAIIKMAQWGMAAYQANEIRILIQDVAKEYTNLDEQQKEERLRGLVTQLAVDIAIDASLGKLSRALKVEEALFEEIYIAAKSNPNRIVFANALEGFMEDEFLSKLSKNERGATILTLDDISESVKQHLKYKQQVPNTKIELEDVLRQRSHGRELTENGRWARIDGIGTRNVPDKPGYKRKSNSTSETLELTGEFRGQKIKLPNSEQELTVDDVVQLRQQKRQRISELEEGELRGVLSLEAKTELAVARHEVTIFSELLGTSSASYQVDKNFTVVRKLTSSFLDNRKTGQFDEINLIRDDRGQLKILEVEAKGGINPNNQYGTRQVSLSDSGEIESAQQGSKVYKNNIWENMQKEYDKAVSSPAYLNNELSSAQMLHLKGLGETLKLRRNLGEINSIYISIEQPIDKVSGELKNPKIKYLD